jgi:hypothetical protein
VRQGEYSLPRLMPHKGFLLSRHGIPLKACLGLKTPAASGILAVAAPTMLPSAGTKTSASAMG